MLLQALNAANTAATDPVAWYNVVGQFRLKCQEFNTAWNNLINMSSFVNTHPTLQSEYQSLLSTGQTIKSKIKSITGLIDKTVSMFSNAWSTVTSYFNEVDRSNQLGFIGLVPIAVIVASIAAIAYFVDDVYKFQTKVNQIKAMEAAGSTPQAAITAANNMAPSSLTTIKNIALPVAGTIAFIVLIGFLRRK